MFPYDSAIVEAVATTPQSVSDVLAIMRKIDSVCDAQDGLKWFNWLYMTVTEAIEDRTTSGGFDDVKWIAELDVVFARFYFDAVALNLSGRQCSASWNALLAVRNDERIARIQFAMAGMNAHINHDLAVAIVSTCKATNVIPQHGTTQYSDYTAVNSTLNSLVDEAKSKLNVRLPGDPLPAVSHLEDLVAAVDLAAFRETAWVTAQSLWGAPDAEINFRIGLRDGIVATLNTALLVPVP